MDYKLAIAVGVGAGVGALAADAFSVNGRFSRAAVEASVAVFVTVLLRRKVGFFRG